MYYSMLNLHPDPYEVELDVASPGEKETVSQRPHDPTSLFQLFGFGFFGMGWRPPLMARDPPPHPEHAEDPA